ncbi:hypothetical protein CLE01_34120 [Cryobacterium levicorallinum]|nr:hypothetical protein CLE01_34120 [Cryobacterium levicorallinum]
MVPALSRVEPKSGVMFNAAGEELPVLTEAASVPRNKTNVEAAGIVLVVENGLLAEESPNILPALSLSVIVADTSLMIWLPR